ncbi:MAG: cobalt-precorrin 5A hydrolase [Candidatus Kentron sp. G]|nr:MAG: cobalt-precorrin 5A hydrolase [Candidatus Kentron sp. G]VFM96726.1 MAG: cobalt-precorrin 5A hydrolase [Candidatus Kentron sp. G]VFM98906.1 MAG: cobalt-precorrin 5A hydrolase [Candidatus Kentron sp. G]
MTIPQGKIIIGIGCDRGASQQTLEEALGRALALIGRTRDAVAGLASIDRKSDEAGLLALSTQHGWPLYFYNAAHLAKVPVPNPSETVRKHMGTPAVSEAAAVLAIEMGAAGMGAAETGAAGTGVSGLILEKYKYRGNDGRHVTISIAGTENDARAT